MPYLLQRFLGGRRRVLNPLLCCFRVFEDQVNRRRLVGGSWIPRLSYGHGFGERVGSIDGRYCLFEEPIPDVGALSRCKGSSNLLLRVLLLRVGVLPMGKDQGIFGSP